MDDVSKLGPLWVNELIHHVQSKRNRVAENMLLIKPDGDYAKQHQMVLDVADAMLAAPDLLAALNNILVGMEASGGWAGDDGLFDAGMRAYKKATGVAP